MSHVEFQICPKERVLLAASGFGTFEDLMFKNSGELLSAEERAQTLRLELPCVDGPAVRFLKRTLLHRGRKNVQALLSFQRPHTDVYREMQLVQKLQNSGIPVMRILAWGEERKFGFPIRGFILTEGVSGQLLHELFLAGDSETRAQIATAFGSFVARLHRLGFFQIVRLKDLICSVSPGSVLKFPSLTLIDRAACKSGQKFFWPQFCLQSLQRGFRRMKRDGIVFEPEVETRFAAAYADGISDRWNIAARDLQTKLRPKK